MGDAPSFEFAFPSRLNETPPTTTLIAPEPNDNRHTALRFRLPEAPQEQTHENEEETANPEEHLNEDAFTEEHMLACPHLAGTRHRLCVEELLNIYGATYFFSRPFLQFIMSCIGDEQPDEHTISHQSSVVELVLRVHT